MDMKIDDMAKAAWCTALAVPELLQARGMLYGEISRSDGAGMGYCCLGVFAKSQGASFEFELVTEEDDEGNDIRVIEEDATVAWASPQGDLLDLNNSELLDQTWADQFGLTAEHQSFLGTLNDGGESIISKSNPFFLLYQKYCESESAPRTGASDETRLFKMKQHSFAEIREIILVEF